MSDNDQDKKDQQALQKVEAMPPAETSLKLNSDIIDLSGLDEKQVSVLKQKRAEMQIEIEKKAMEMKVDVAALDASLSSFTSQTEKATLAGNSATIQHSQSSTLGRTEIVIGNTDKAASGKLSQTASGTPYKNIMIMAIIAIAAVFIAFALGGR